MKFADTPLVLLFVCLLSSVGVVVAFSATYVLIGENTAWWPIALLGLFWLWAAVSSGRRLSATQAPVDPRVTELDRILRKGMPLVDAIEAVRVNHELVTPPRYYTHSVELEVRGVIFEVFSTEGMVTGWTAK